MKKVVLSLMVMALLAVGFISVTKVANGPDPLGVVKVAYDNWPDPTGVVKVAFDIGPDPHVIQNTTV